MSQGIKEKLKLVNILAALSLEERDEIYTLVDNQVTFVSGALANAGRADAAQAPRPIVPVTAVSTVKAAVDAAPVAQAPAKKKPGPKPGSKKTAATPAPAAAPLSTASSDPVAQAMASLESVDLS